MSDLEPLSDFARALREEERHAPLETSANRDLQARVRAKIEQAIGASLAPLSTHPGSVHSAPTQPAPTNSAAPHPIAASPSPAEGLVPAKVSRAVVSTAAAKSIVVSGHLVAIAVASFVAGAAGGVAVDRAILRSPSRVPPVVVEAPRATIDTSDTPLPVSSSSPTHAPSAISAPIDSTPIVHEVRAAPSSSTSDADLHNELLRERTLIDAARAGVASGNPTAALNAVERHSRAFPNGRLREEREALRIFALSALGRETEAKQAAGAFRQTYPQSLFTSQIDEVVR